MTSDRSYRSLEWTDEVTSRFWRWQARFPHQYFTYQFGREIARQIGPWITGKRHALDYGCGPGYMVRHLAARADLVSASDFSEAAVSATRTTNADIVNFRGAALTQELVASDLRFDAIVSIEVIEHLSNDHLENFFSNVHKLLSDDGVVIVTTPNQEDLALAENYCPHCDHVFHRWQHQRSWTAETLPRALQQRGFSVIRTFTADFSRTPFRDPVDRLKRLVKRLLARPDKLPHLVCVARRKS